MARHVETLNYLQHLKPPVDFVVPIVFAPQGIEVLHRQDLLNLLEQTEQSSQSESVDEGSGLPL